GASDDETDGPIQGTTADTHDTTDDGVDDAPPADQAELHISHGPVLDFGFVLLGTPVSQTLTIENTGGAAASNIIAQPLPGPFSFVGGAYPGDGGTCTQALSPGESCTIIVELRANAPTSFAAELVRTHTHGDGRPGEAMRPLRGGGISDNLVVNGGGEEGGTPPTGWVPPPDIGPGSWAATACERAAPLNAPPGTPLAGDH